MKAVHPGGSVLVDEKLAPLLEAAWRLDVRTEFSCQGTVGDPNDKAYIVFADTDSAARLLRALISGIDDRRERHSFYHQQWSARPGAGDETLAERWARERAWEWVVDWPPYVSIDDGAQNVRMRLSVYFPAMDIEQAAAYLAAAARALPATVDLRRGRA